MPDDTPTPPAEPRPAWQRYLRYGVMALLALLPVISAVATREGCPKVVTVIEYLERAAPLIVEPADEFTPPQGWVNDPESSRAAAEAMPTRVFADTPAGQTDDLPPHAYLWQAHQKLTGAPPPLKDQNPTGSCVGFGTTTAVERTLACEIVQRGGHPSEFTLFSEEVTYAGSRVEANGGRSPIRGDGSNGSWAARFVTKWGMVPKAKYGGIDLTQYSASRARAWNYSGVPDELEPVARKFPVKDATRITNWRDAKRALANGYGIQVASSQGFVRQRDGNGVAQPGPRWAHSMCLDGYHIENGKEYGHIENSWARTNYHVGPVGWGNPTTAGFWAESEVIERMLREGDSWAYSGAVGFPRKVVPLDWNIRAVPARPEVFAAIRPDFALAP
jgi:hypothetical protein